MTTLLALLIAVSILAGCSGGVATDVKNAAAAPPELMLAAEELQPAEPVYTVETEVWEDTILAEDGTELVHYIFRIPQMFACYVDGSPIIRAERETEEAALETADTFNQQFSTWTDGEGLAELTKAAQADLTLRRESGFEWEFPYELELSTSIYSTDCMVSVSATYERFTGVAHPNTYLMSWNYDLTGGAFFTAEALAADSQLFRDAVQEEIIRQTGISTPEEAVAAGYWEDYADIAADWSSYAVSFDEEGMTVAFSPYELACYASGPQIFSLTYGQVEPYLSDHGRTVLSLERE